MDLIRRDAARRPDSFTLSNPETDYKEGNNTVKIGGRPEGSSKRIILPPDLRNGKKAAKEARDEKRMKAGCRKSDELGSSLFLRCLHPGGLSPVPGGWEGRRSILQ